jgi:hypothetical protein
MLVKNKRSTLSLAAFVQVIVLPLESIKKCRAVVKRILELCSSAAHASVAQRPVLALLAGIPGTARFLPEFRR